MQSGERSGQFTGHNPESSRRGTDLAQCRNCQQPARRQPRDDRIIEACVPKPVTDNDIDSGTRREPAVEIDDGEPAAVANTTALGKVSRLLNCH